MAASLVESEAKVKEDRPLIASVISNRLQKGMKLQIDATVLYALGAHKDRVLNSDLEIDSLCCLDAGDVQVIERATPKVPLVLTVLAVVEVHHQVIVAAVFRNGDASGFRKPAPRNLAFIFREQRRPLWLQREILD